MENMGNATPTTSWHQLHWWKSARWIVIRIEALAVVAIIFSFFLAAFGSCRRWSNSWIVQKGFFIAQVLSLSLGTYSIGLMQSSWVKSEMYPIWTVSLFTLFGCIDPVTTYNGLDYKGPLSKVVYGICLNCGYVLLMSISAISNVVGNTAIIILSAITFIKSFHRSFALVEQKKLCDMVYISSGGEHYIFHKAERNNITISIVKDTCRHDTKASRRSNRLNWLLPCYDAWLALCLSHKLRRYILAGLDYDEPNPTTVRHMDLKWALNVIEIELAFVYDALFTGNAFLHYYQAKTASLWALASFTGICFVLVATAIPGRMIGRSGASGAYTKVVDTTTVDIAITFGILVSLALLQLTQLVRSWTSNWARAAVFCAYTGKDGENLPPRVDPESWQWGHLKMIGWMRLKVFVATSTNLFDKYLWQDKIGQYSILPKPRLLAGRERKGEWISSSKAKGEQIWPASAKGEKRGRTCVDWVPMFGLHYIWLVIRELLSSVTNKRGGIKLEEDVKASIPDPELSSPSEIEGERTSSTKTKGERISKRCVDLVQMLGLHYIWQVIWELLSSDTNKRGGVKLDQDVKGSVIDFLGQIYENKVDWRWLYSLPKEPEIRYFLPQVSAPQLLRPEDHCYRYTSCVMTWHIATWYCEQKSKEEDALMSKQAEAPICYGGEKAARYYLRKAAAAIRRLSSHLTRRGEEGVRTKSRDDRHVANALSQYCAYLVKSAPELLPGPVAWAKRVYDRFSRDAKEWEDTNTISGNMSDRIVCCVWKAQGMEDSIMAASRISNGKALANLLIHGRSSDELWKTLALVWVQLLVYAAPHGIAEAHMRHLSQGGEFITHLWAMLYHLDIREWKVMEVNNLDVISTVEHAKMILNDFSDHEYDLSDLSDDGHDFDIVVLFLSHDILQLDRDDFVTAAKLVDGVKFYLTSSPDVAKCLYFPEFILEDESNSGGKVLFINKADKKHMSFYDFSELGLHEPWDIAQFVYEKKLAWAKARAQGTTPCTSHNPIPIEKQAHIYQRTEDGQTVVEIAVKKVYDISTVEDAQRILNDEDLDIVVLFCQSDAPQIMRDNFANASKLVDCVKFYFTSSPDVAKCLYFPESVLEKSIGSILFLNKADKKITFYDPMVHGHSAWNIARFASAKARAQETAGPSTTRNPIPIEKQSWEEGETESWEEGETEGEITVEIQQPS